jgi:hypothetical protein
MMIFRYVYMNIKMIGFNFISGTFTMKVAEVHLLALQICLPLYLFAWNNLRYSEEIFTQFDIGEFC